MKNAPRQSLIAALWLGYLIFTVYGSLVPLDYRPLSLDQAWQLFLQTPMLELGVESRADWIANGVLYVPVGFLTGHLLMQRFDGRHVFAAFLAGGVFSVGLALGVEFTQLFFPPRTVSLNDLLAEWIGSFVGLFLAVRYAAWFKALLHALAANSRRVILHLAEAYLIGYVAFSLFPYDILLSTAEIAQKLQGSNWNWLLVADEHGAGITLLKLGSEVLLTLPFGLYLGYHASRGRATVGSAVLAGGLLGCFIEVAQFFMASGVSQGASVLTRVMGTGAGLLLWQRQAHWSAAQFAATVRRHAALLGAVYLLVLLLASGWLRYAWLSLDQGLARVAELNFLPFYYHYYTTEAKALVSLASISLIYLPVGLMVWAVRQPAAVALVGAAGLSAIVETGKLFLSGTHPDPSNVIIGGVAAWGGVHLANMLVNAARLDEESLPGQAASRSGASPVESRPTAPANIQSAGWPVLTLAWASMLAAGYVAATFPTMPALLCLGLAAAAVAMWRAPVRIVILIPAALPLLDLAPWSGRFFLDEFDLLLATAIAIAYLRSPSIPLASDRWFKLAATLLAISYLASALRGVLPWQMPDANTFTNYYSPFNALRVAKGALWGIFLLGLFNRFVAQGHNVVRLFARGMTIGLAGTVLVILWERLSFPGLFNFSDVYRVTGPFSQMHVGGADIETYLAVGTPFVILQLYRAQSPVRRGGYGLLLLAVSYCVMVTYSRVGYAGWGLAFILALAAFVVGPSTARSVSRLGNTVSAIVLLVAALGIVSPIFFSQFAQARMALAGTDLIARSQHWDDALDLRDPGWVASMFGMGLGRYPESHYWRSNEPRSGGYWLGREETNQYLRQGAGSPLYVEQFVAAAPGEEYLVDVKVRSSASTVGVALSICEKWLLTSARCSHQQLPLNGNGSWQTIQVRMSTGDVGKHDGLIARPVKFAMHTTGQAGIVDIDDLRLTNSTGDNLLKNGNFSNGLDHWFFSVDNDLPWHAWSLPIQVLFEQGWLGVLALGVFMLGGLWRSGSEFRRGNIEAGVVFAAGGGFFTIGLLDSLVDSPRLLLLCLTIFGMCWGNNNRAPGGRDQ